MAEVCWAMMNRYAGVEIDELEQDGRHTLKLTGELDIASAPTLHGAIARACAGDPRSLTLDLSGLTFIDSTGLAEIILASKLCERDGREYTLIPGPRAVQRIFELTGLMDILPFAAEQPLEGGPQDPET